MHELHVYGVACSDILSWLHTWIMWQYSTMTMVLLTCEKSKKIQQGCLEVEVAKISVTLDGDALQVVCAKFTCQDPTWGPMRWCFELIAHVKDMEVFEKVVGAERQEGNAVAVEQAQSWVQVLFTHNESCTQMYLCKGRW